MIRRIDHLICEVPDIVEAVRHFTQGLGFPLAWPIGRFWPTGLTAGVGIGGMNLEFIQPDEGASAKAFISTLVFEPTSVEAAMTAVEEQGLNARLFEKYEDDPERLTLRGFPPEMTGSRQLICRNVLVVGDVPIPFFFCAYTDLLRERLGPDNPALKSAHGRVRTIGMRISGDVGLFERMGYADDVEIREQAGEPPMVTEIRLETGPVDLQGFPAEFRFS